MPRALAPTCGSTRYSRPNCRKSRSWSRRGTGPRITNGTPTSGWRWPAAWIPRSSKTSGNRRPPHFDDPKAQAIYDVAKSLHETHKLPKPLYDHATKVLGERGLVEIIGLCGYYTMVSMTLNTYEFDLPEGETSDLAE